MFTARRARAEPALYCLNGIVTLENYHIT
jgi:hypothetical protein